MLLIHNMKGSKKAQNRKKECSFDEALKAFKCGNVDVEKAAKMCGVTVRYFSRQANTAGVSTCRYDKDGKPELTESEKIRRRSRKKKNVALDEKIKLAKELGVSYGKLSAMLRMGAI